MPRNLAEVWKYFNSEIPSGQKRKLAKVTCLYCSKEYKIGNATRMTQHILACKECPEELKAEFEKPSQYIEVEEVTNDDTVWSELDQDQEEAASYEGSSPPARKKPRAVKQEPGVGVKDDVRASSALSVELPSLHVDAALARALYASALPLTLLQSRYWQQALAGAGVNAPRADALRGDLLDAEHARLAASVQHKMQEAKALALLVESWKNDSGKINIVIITPEPIFYRAIHCAEITDERMGDEILKVIAEIGSRKLFAVVTDCDMEDVWSLITSKYPHIACVDCVSHSLNLLCGDIMMNINIIKKTVQTATEILSYIKNNSSVSNEFEKLQIDMCGINKRSLKLPNKTKWNAGIWILYFFKASKDVLEALAKRSNKISKGLRNQIFNQQLWTNLNGILEVVSPLSEALQHAESMRAALSEPPAYLARLAAALRRIAAAASDSCFTFEELNWMKTAVNRRIQNLKPIHLAANLLDPRYRGAHVGDQIPIATQYITDLASYLFDDDDEKVSEVLVSLACFQTKTGYFGMSESIWRPVQALLPGVWWRTFAPAQPVAAVATRALSLPPAAPHPALSALCSLYATVRDDTALSTQRLDRLIYVRNNLRLMDTSDEPEEELKQVDIHSIFPAGCAAGSQEEYNIIVVNNPLGDF